MVAVQNIRTTECPAWKWTPTCMVIRIQIQIFDSTTLWPKNRLVIQILYRILIMVASYGPTKFKNIGDGIITRPLRSNDPILQG